MNNGQADYGGSAYLEEIKNLTILNCIFNNNTATLFEGPSLYII